MLESACSNDIQEWCRSTVSPDELDTVDAILFHNRDFNQSLYPKRRNNSVVYVMVTLESPVHEEVVFLPDQINWTMNYRRDADVYTPYVIAKQLDKPVKIDYSHIWNMKNSSLTTVWMASNCNTTNKRRELIEKIQQEGLSIDIFGGCGKVLQNCKRSYLNRSSCATEILQKYKFYIAFENSNCPDYVTEKVDNAFNLYLAVPIVLQRKIYENVGIPSNSFIALDDFNSTIDLVTFINELQHDRQRYMEYHNWRDTSQVISLRDERFCSLCQLLRTRVTPRQSYSNLRDWYSKDTCNTAALFRYLKNNTLE